MILKLAADHVIKQSPTCGEIHEILRHGEYSPTIALALNIGPTTPHYHLTYDETYFVLDGTLELKLHDPSTNTTSTHKLEANELCVITKGIHHQVIHASPANRLCVISVPAFDLADEHLSDKL